ncbi:MAG: alpha-amylase family glycosyl hydrolase [Nitrospiraceae bacterium]|nr:alpha-amylase family glycosyl hydrolase [Nitrospiraceae bacterium]
MKSPRLYEVNAIQWLYGLSQVYKKRFTIGDVPGAEWDRLHELGFDYVWLMGIWKRSKMGLRIFRQGPEWPPFAKHLDSVLPGWKDEDVIGSPYSISAYEPDPLAGTWEEIKKARAELHKRGMGLILDFVPNHTAPDHKWVLEHPDYYFVADRSADWSAFEQNTSLCSPVTKGNKTLYVARGKDPNYPAWSDTAQLNYFNPALRKAMVGELKKIAGYCDGIRCDMAMLVINDIFERDWSGPAKGMGAVWEKPGAEFWEQARAAVPGLILMAEAYWDTEWRLTEMGFDYVYDKTLYERLRYASARDIKLHLGADAGYQKKLVRFIENHDEPRSAEAMGPDRLRAAAILFSTLPGMKLYYHGQLEGRRIKLPVQLGRDVTEGPVKELENFYERLLSITGQDVFHTGQWRLKDVFPFADGSYQNLIAYTWKSASRLKLVVVNFDGGSSQGRIPLGGELDSGKDYRLTDELNGREYERRGADMSFEGLQVILGGYQAHIFDMVSA